MTTALLVLCLRRTAAAPPRSASLPPLSVVGPGQSVETRAVAARSVRRKIYHLIFYDGALTVDTQYWLISGVGTTNGYALYITTATSIFVIHFHSTARWCEPTDDRWVHALENPEGTQGKVFYYLGVRRAMSDLRIRWKRFPYVSSGFQYVFVCSNSMRKNFFSERVSAV